MAKIMAAAEEQLEAEPNLSVWLEILEYISENAEEFVRELPEQGVTIEVLRGYESDMEYILSETKTEPAMPWKEVKEALADEVDPEELPYLAQWLGVSDDESLVDFNDWCTLANMCVQTGVFDPELLPSLPKRSQA